MLALPIACKSAALTRARHFEILCSGWIQEHQPRLEFDTALSVSTTPNSEQVQVQGRPMRARFLHRRRRVWIESMGIAPSATPSLLDLCTGRTPTARTTSSPTCRGCPPLTCPLASTLRKGGRASGWIDCCARATLKMAVIRCRSGVRVCTVLW